MTPAAQEPATLLARTLDRHPAPVVEALLPGMDAPDAAGEILGSVERWLGPVERLVFVRPGVGLVVGLVLDDGRGVVLKLHRWNVDVERLSAVQEVQAALWSRGLPAPRPLLSPRPLGRGLATTEELLAGDRADGRAPATARALAVGLAELLRATRDLVPLPQVGSNPLQPVPGGPLWGEPHDLRFDFEASAGGAEWIDELAARAKAVLAAADLPQVIAHLDWRVENVAFAEGRLAAIYDWDSLALAPEAVAVGQASAQFSTDWSIGFESLPSMDEMRSFVRSYESHLGRRFDADEWAALEAANLLLCAYGARCEHSDRSLQPSGGPAPETSWITLLRQRAEQEL